MHGREQPKRTLPCPVFCIFCTFKKKLFYNIFISIIMVFHYFQSSLRDPDIHSPLLSWKASTFNPIVWTEPVVFVLCFTHTSRQVTPVTGHNIHKVLTEFMCPMGILFKIQHLKKGRERERERGRGICWISTSGKISVPYMDTTLLPQD